jgi:hypothetical protein
MVNQFSKLIQNEIKSQNDEFFSNIDGHENDDLSFKASPRFQNEEETTPWHP